MSSGPFKWGVCYATIGDELAPISAFGFDGPVPLINRQTLSSAHETGMLVSPQHFGDDARVVPLGDDAYFVLSGVPLATRELLDVLASIPRLPATLTKRHDISHRETLDGSSAKIIVERGRSKSWFFVSLFYMDGAPLWRRVKKRCAHAIPGTIEAGLYRYVSDILGQSGISMIAPDGRTLSAYYSHYEADPELIASQVSITLRKALRLRDEHDIVFGPYLSAALGSDASEPIIRSFIDGS